MYKAGMLDGKAENFYPDGRLASIENWKEDLQEDTAWYYHPNGVLHRKGIYESGVYQGIWVTFFPNSLHEQTIHYTDGLPDGPSKNWNEKGVLIETGSYHAGRKHGQFVFFDNSTGKIHQTGSYCSDLPCGLWLTFNKREKIISKEWR